MSQKDFQKIEKEIIEHLNFLKFSFNNLILKLFNIVGAEKCDYG
jgi:hypothetical protein